MRKRLLTGAYWLLAASFVVGAVTKYWPGPTFYGPPYSVKFVEWGYPSWFRFVIGTVEFLCAILLVIPRRDYRFLGAAILVVVLTGATLTHIINRNVLYESVAAPTLLVIMLAIAWTSRPPDLFTWAKSLTKPIQNVLR